MAAFPAHVALADETETDADSVQDVLRDERLKHAETEAQLEKERIGHGTTKTELVRAKLECADSSAKIAELGKSLAKAAADRDKAESDRDGFQRLAAENAKALSALTAKNELALKDGARIAADMVAAQATRCQELIAQAASERDEYLGLWKDAMEIQALVSVLAESSRDATKRMMLVQKSDKTIEKKATKELKDAVATALKKASSDLPKEPVRIQPQAAAASATAAAAVTSSSSSSSSSTSSASKST